MARIFYSHANFQKGTDFSDTLEGVLDRQNILDGGKGADLLIAKEQGDRLMGGVGNDTLVGVEGSYNSQRPREVLSGGLGDDTYFVATNNSVVSEQVNAGKDKAFLSSKQWTNYGNIEEITAIEGGLTEVITGQTGSEKITGNSLPNTIFGGGGDDTISGGGGDDILLGGDGTNFLSGGQGTDLFCLDNFGEIIIDDFNPSEDCFSFWIDPAKLVFLPAKSEAAIKSNPYCYFAKEGELFVDGKRKAVLPPGTVLSKENFRTPEIFEAKIKEFDPTNQQPYCFLHLSKELGDRLKIDVPLNQIVVFERMPRKLGAYLFAYVRGLGALYKSGELCLQIGYGLDLSGVIDG